MRSPSARGCLGKVTRCTAQWPPATQKPPHGRPGRAARPPAPTGRLEGCGSRRGRIRRRTTGPSPRSRAMRAARRRHLLPPPPPRAARRGKDARLQGARAVRVPEHLQPPRIVPGPQWCGGSERTRRRDQPSVRTRQLVDHLGAIRKAAVPRVRGPVFEPHGSISRNRLKRRLSAYPPNYTASPGPTSERSTINSTRHFTPSKAAWPAPNRRVLGTFHRTYRRSALDLRRRSRRRTAARTSVDSPKMMAAASATSAR